LDLFDVVVIGAGAAGIAAGSAGAAAVPDDRPVALLVMGDGTARRGEKAPGYADPRAEAFDATVVRALAGGDPRTLADLDPTLAAELLVAGRAPWQVLAGAALAARPGGAWRADLRYADAPYGVGYAVASWS
jgi:aromatic ring-opening dioxygenase LigB subunit